MNWLSQFERNFGQNSQCAEVTEFKGWNFMSKTILLLYLTYFSSRLSSYQLATICWHGFFIKIRPNQQSPVHMYVSMLKKNIIIYPCHSSYFLTRNCFQAIIEALHTGNLLQSVLGIVQKDFSTINSKKWTKSICTWFLQTSSSKYQVWWTGFLVYYKLEFCRLHRQ